MHLLVDSSLILSICKCLRSTRIFSFLQAHLIEEEIDKSRWGELESESSEEESEEEDEDEERDMESGLVTPGETCVFDVMVSLNRILQWHFDMQLLTNCFSCCADNFGPAGAFSLTV
jgi:hypothetical protein